jgi:hypothetical protein
VSESLLFWIESVHEIRSDNEVRNDRPCGLVVSPGYDDVNLLLDNIFTVKKNT